MTRGTFRLKVIALVAAYAMALQGLFAAFAPIAAAQPAGVLCSGQILDGPANETGHDPSCASACAMLGAVAAPPRSIEIALLLVGPLPAPSLTSPLVATQRGPRTARAPPLV